MGSKTQTTTKEKKSTEYCKICDRTFLTKQAIRAHQIAKHPDEKVDTKQNKKEIIEQDVAKNTPTARVSKRLQIKKGINEEKHVKIEYKPQVKSNPPKMQVKASSGQVKTEFSCPKCSKVFNVYFHAQKHIQKRHSEGENGDSSSTDAMDIKPIRKDTCTECTQDITEDPNTHTCGEQNSYKCLGCDKSFNSLPLFNEHVVVEHNDNIDTMMLVNNTDFITWKTNMELQTKSKYTVIDNKKCYQCNYVSPKNLANLTYLCPSMVVSTECSEGVKVQYYKNHSGHIASPYKILADYKNKLIDLPTNEDDDKEVLYKKFKTLMTKITVNAAKADVKTLKKLLDNAIDMQDRLNERHHDGIKSKNITDDQITEVLEGKRKRKPVTPVPDSKKTKLDNGDSPKPFKLINQSPSFNDSYKQFVDSSCNVTGDDKKPRKVVKTKIGQFSPRTSPKSNKKPNILRPNKNNLDLKNTKIDDVEYEILEQENDCNILVLKI